MEREAAAERQTYFRRVRRNDGNKAANNRCRRASRRTAAADRALAADHQDPACKAASMASKAEQMYSLHIYWITGQLCILR
jgi:hypothetical protein